VSPGELNADIGDMRMLGEGTDEVVCPSGNRIGDPSAFNALREG